MSTMNEELQRRISLNSSGTDEIVNTPSKWNPYGIDTDGDVEEPDMVNHPKHYKASNGMEAIDVIEAFTDGLNGIEATDTGNVIKYILRWKDKNGIEDLRKILWYTNHLIEYLERDTHQKQTV